MKEMDTQLSPTLAQFFNYLRVVNNFHQNTKILSFNLPPTFPTWSIIHVTFSIKFHRVQHTDTYPSLLYEVEKFLHGHKIFTWP